MNEIEKKLKEKIIDEKLYYVTKGGQKVHCFDLISYDDALEICKQVKVEPEVIVPERNSFGQWINVNKKKPEKFESVILYDEAQGETFEVNEGFWDGYEWNFARDDYKPKKVIKWMPLPKP